MKYQSTRSDGNDGRVSSAEAIKLGLAPDGGLYVPETIPAVDAGFLTSLLRLDYRETAVRILSLFLDDYTEEELSSYCSSAYSSDSFPGDAVPVIRVHDNINALELWHGPTAAFKDMALQLMPRLLSGALKKTGEQRTALVLVATSGDTGKAALEGYKDVDGVRIKVYYPVNGVSRVQKLQMITQSGDNVDVCAIHGNFDDAQTGVKSIFSNHEIASELNSRGFFLSSANSINWGRLVPQVVYYFYGYCSLVRAGTINIGDRINICVPTGNFGNIFAAYIALRMGLPVNKLICASNSNNVLTDFINTGVYDKNRVFHTTMSPSMDILISSNLERLLYFTAGSAEVRDYMSRLSRDGKYTVPEETMNIIRSIFTAGCANEEQTSLTIRETYDNYGYLCDTHTAVGMYCAERYIADTADTTPVLLASTASPFKFAGSVYRSLTDCKPPEDYAALEALSQLTGITIPAPLAGLDRRRIRFESVISPSAMARDLIEKL